MEERLLDLRELGNRLAAVDSMLMQLIKRRMELAGQVGRYKALKGENIFRAEVEDNRLETIRKIAVSHGLNPNFAASILYALIGESCKLQMIQLQEEATDKKYPESDDQWYAQLKRNLLVLTQRCSGSYDTAYDDSYFATKAYLKYEQALIGQEIQKLPDTEFMLDLGCATGRVSLTFYEQFDRVTGYDLSQYMQTRANQLAEDKNLHSRLSFECADLEDGIPAPDACASFVVMNLGTASDMRDIRTVLTEMFRVLKPGGRFFLSFYNRGGLIYHWEFLPWQAGLAATVNTHCDSLEVRSVNEEGREEVIPVYARAYTNDEVMDLLADNSQDLVLTSYPTISAILPDQLFTTEQPGVKETIIAMDESLAQNMMGAYLIATGAKPL